MSSRCSNFGQTWCFSLFSWLHQLMISPWPSHGVFVWGKRPVPWSRAGSAWRGSSAAKSCHWSRRRNGNQSWTENDLRTKRSMWKFYGLNVEEKTRAFSNSRDFRVQWFEWLYFSQMRPADWNQFVRTEKCLQNFPWLQGPPYAPQIHPVLCVKSRRAFPKCRGALHDGSQDHQLQVWLADQIELIGLMKKTKNIKKQFQLTSNK